MLPVPFNHQGILWVLTFSGILSKMLFYVFQTTIEIQHLARSLIIISKYYNITPSVIDFHKMDIFVSAKGDLTVLLDPQVYRGTGTCKTNQSPLFYIIVRKKGKHSGHWERKMPFLDQYQRTSWFLPRAYFFMSAPSTGKPFVKTNFRCLTEKERALRQLQKTGVLLKTFCSYSYCTTCILL